ncbi:MAG TPA: hypothetical protein PKI08_02565 [Aquaticitalea sp.]|mgnify:CR=1 FL=1|nr:hypothetical protein [Aquaticitalea sp.]
MKLIHRVAYYLGGFSIGLIILAFILQGKKTSCDYGPNARTTKNIANKKKNYSDAVKTVMTEYQMDTLDVSNLIRFGDVDFSKSDTKAMDCKLYVIYNSYKKKEFEITVENCDSLAKVVRIQPKN